MIINNVMDATFDLAGCKLASLLTYGTSTAALVMMGELYMKVERHCVNRNNLALS